MHLTSLSSLLRLAALAGVVGGAGCNAARSATNESQAPGGGDLNDVSGADGASDAGVSEASQQMSDAGRDAAFGIDASKKTGPAVVRIAAGGNQSCAIRDDDSVLCWGAQSVQYSGTGTFASLTPAIIPGLIKPMQVGLGALFACALLASKEVYCWGLGAAIGPGAISSAAPINVGLSNVTAIAAGGSHMCAVVAGGVVKCWGDNVVGQLGPVPGNAIASATPVEVTAVAGATAIAAGDSHTCAVLPTGGASCWGNNYNGAGGGQLGRPTTGSYDSTPGAVGMVTNAQALALGLAHSCALLTTGGVTCWGGNFPQAVAGVTGATSIVSGSFHACALVPGGQATCWGYDNYGELGTGTTLVGQGSASHPVTVVSDIRQIVAGDHHTCALLGTGAVACWGNDDYGQLGNGTKVGSPMASIVAGL